MYDFAQLSESMKQNQADLYLETYQVLDIEIGRLREMQRWQSSAAFKVFSLEWVPLGKTQKGILEKEKKKKTGFKCGLGFRV